MAESIRTWLSWRGPLGADGVLGLALVAIGFAELVRTGTGGGSPYVAYVGTALACGVIAWRRVAPMAVATCVYAAVFGLLAYGFDNDNLGQFIAYLVAAYSLGAHTQGREASLKSLAVFFVVAGIGAAQFIGFSDGAGFMFLSIGACVIGALIRRGTVTAHELRTEAQTLNDEREVRANAAVAEERRRIARELHDVVAHTVSLLVLQTGAGRKALRSDPERADEMLRSAEATGRQAVAEMRRLVGIMRIGEPMLHAQPGLGQVERLAESARQSGKPVDLSVQGQPQALPPGLELAAYRIIQEALTNSIKHAGPAPLTIMIRHGKELSIEVSDEGPSTGLTWPPEETGQGLAGMRERTQLYNGHLEVGPTGTGGLRIVATLPTGEIP